MNNLQRVNGTTMALWRALPTWGKIVTVIVGTLTALYFFQFIVGLFLIAAMCVGAYTLLKWLLKS